MVRSGAIRFQGSTVQEFQRRTNKLAEAGLAILVSSTLKLWSLELWNLLSLSLWHSRERPCLAGTQRGFCRAVSKMANSLEVMNLGQP